MALSAKQSAFIEEYLRCWNATDAYMAIYSKSSRDAARAHAARLVANGSVAEEIKARIAERAMSANEVLDRLADHARADYKDFISQTGDGEVILDIAKAEGKTHLIKKISQRRMVRTTKDVVVDETTISVELHDAQAALVQIGKHHKLFVERQEVTGKDGGPIEAKVNHAIDSDTAGTIFDILARVGALPSAGDDAKDDGVDTP